MCWRLPCTRWEVRARGPVASQARLLDESLNSPVQAVCFSPSSSYFAVADADSFVLESLLHHAEINLQSTYNPLFMRGGVFHEAFVTAVLSVFLETSETFDLSSLDLALHSMFRREC